MLTKREIIRSSHISPKLNKKRILHIVDLGAVRCGILGMDKKTVHELIQQKQVEDSMKQEFEQTLSDRAARYLQVKPHGIIPYEHFSAASARVHLTLSG